MSQRIVRHPEYLNGEALPLLNPRMHRLWWGLVPVVAVTVIGIVMGGENWTMGLALLALWLLWVGVVWLDHRAWMRATDDLLEVRSGLRTQQVMASDVARVVHKFQGKRPDFQIRTTDGRKIWVPTSKLERGHGVLFTWLDMHAPQAQLDPKSSWWRQQMIDRELI